MIRVNEIKDNPSCVASITVRVRKVKTTMQVGNKTHKILGIYRRPQLANTQASDNECPEDS
jgi:hypothetical protein